MAYRRVLAVFFSMTCWLTVAGDLCADEKQDTKALQDKATEELRALAQAVAKPSNADKSAKPQDNAAKAESMQKTLDGLKADLNKTRAERTDIQGKIDLSDKDIAKRKKRIEDIKKQLKTQQNKAKKAKPPTDKKG